MSQKSEIAEQITRTVHARLDRTLSDDHDVPATQAIDLILAEARKVLTRNRLDPLDVEDILTEARRRLRIQAIGHELSQISLGPLIAQACERDNQTPTKADEPQTRTQKVPLNTAELGIPINGATRGNVRSENEEIAQAATEPPHHHSTLSIKEAASFLKTTRSQVIELINLGCLKCHVVGGRRHVHVGDAIAIKQNMLADDPNNKQTPLGGVRRRSHALELTRDTRRVGRVGRHCPDAPQNERPLDVYKKFVTWFEDIGGERDQTEQELDTRGRNVGPRAVTPRIKSTRKDLIGSSTSTNRPCRKWTMVKRTNTDKGAAFSPQVANTKPVVRTGKYVTKRVVWLSDNSSISPAPSRSPTLSLLQWH